MQYSMRYTMRSHKNARISEYRETSLFTVNGLRMILANNSRMLANVSRRITLQNAPATKGGAD
eukprot:12921214-Prorocentrum_lima.AAC.1